MVYIPFCCFSSNFLFLIWLYFSSSQYYSPSIPFYAPKQLVGSTRLKPAHDGLPQVQVAILGNPEISNEMNQLGWISESQVLTVTYPCVSFLVQSQINKKTTILFAIRFTGIHSTNRNPWWITIWRKEKLQLLFLRPRLRRQKLQLRLTTSKITLSSRRLLSWPRKTWSPSAWRISVGQ